MKFLRTYEIYSDSIPRAKAFYLINIVDNAYFLASLNHINCTDEEIMYFKKIRDHVLSVKHIENFPHRNHKKMYIHRTYPDDDRCYMFYNKSSLKYFSENGFVFLYEIKPTRIELDKQKYNL